MRSDRLFQSFLTSLFALSCSATSDPTPASRGNGQNQGGAGGLNLGSGGTNLNVGGLGTSGGGNTCPTSISGTVYDPSGTLPLYNVVVYVPSEALDAIPEGAACETCDGNFSGRPIAAAVTDSAGHFKVDKMPAGDDVPVVIQVGKWRREISVSVTACTDTPITDTNLTRLPRNKAEGNLPKMAVARGGSDSPECLLHKLGIDDAEFTADAGDGRIHLYYSPEGTATDGTAALASGGSLSDVGTLYSSLEKMMGYDMVLIGCEGTDNSFDGYSVEQFQAVRTYADQGGRLFGSHYNNRWVYWQEYTEETAPYTDVLDFASGAHGFPDGAIVQGAVDASFPKGQAMSEWLVNVQGSTTPGVLDISNGEHTIDGVLHPSARLWVTLSGPDNQGHAAVPQYVSFPTPLDGAECGRMVFSDLHVSSGGKDPFPSGCSSAELTPQEKALAFMIFDLSSCVQPEDEEIKPPTVY